MQVFLRDVVIIQVDEASEDCLQGGGGVEAVGKFLAVVGEDGVDCEECLRDQAFKETAGGGC